MSYCIIEPEKIPTVLERIEVDNQIQHDPDLGSSTSKNDDPSGYYLASDVD